MKGLLLCFKFPGISFYSLSLIISKKYIMSMEIRTDLTAKKQNQPKKRSKNKHKKGSRVCGYLLCVRTQIWLLSIDTTLIFGYNLINITLSKKPDGAV